MPPQRRGEFVQPSTNHPLLPKNTARRVLDRVAWAYAKTEQASSAIRALGRASEALSRHGGEEDPAYLYWVDEGELQIMEARVHVELRRPLRAVPLLTEVLGRYDSTHARELALYLSWLAVALADANEPEEAAHTARRVLALSADMPSGRTARRSQVVLARLRPFRDVREVQDLFDDYGCRVREPVHDAQGWER